MGNILTRERACPICKGDVKGNDEALYFCKTCNILFGKHSLRKDYHPDDEDNETSEEQE